MGRSYELYDLVLFWLSWAQDHIDSVQYWQILPYQLIRNNNAINYCGISIWPQMLYFGSNYWQYTETTLLGCKAHLDNTLSDSKKKCSYYIVTYLLNQYNQIYSVSCAGSTISPQGSASLARADRRLYRSWLAHAAGTDVWCRPEVPARGRGGLGRSAVSMTDALTRSTL